MDARKVKKSNLLYILCYILIPIAIIVLCGWLGARILYDNRQLSSALLTAPTLIAVLWWVFGGKTVYNRKKTAMEKELDDNGFTRNQTFNGSGCTVIVDIAKGQIALLFFWNPFEYFVFPVSHVSKAWVDDGRHGIGFLEGSSRVSFLLLVDGVKIRVNTFTSNKRWRMDSKYILTGISKADMMVKVLEEAGARVH